MSLFIYSNLTWPHLHISWCWESNWKSTNGPQSCMSLLPCDLTRFFLPLNLVNCCNAIVELDSKFSKINYLNLRALVRLLCPVCMWWSAHVHRGERGLCVLCHRNQTYRKEKYLPRETTLSHSSAIKATPRKTMSKVLVVVVNPHPRGYFPFGF